jgi:hypothetical protein
MASSVRLNRLAMVGAPFPARAKSRNRASSAGDQNNAILLLLPPENHRPEQKSALPIHIVTTAYPACFS